MTAPSPAEIKSFSVDSTAVPVESWDDEVRGTLSWHTLVSADRTPSAALTAGIAILAPGGRGELYRHRHAPAEIYLGIAGLGVVVIEDEEFEIGPGRVVFIPGDAWHEVRSVGADELRFYYAFAADSFDGIEYVHARSS